MCNTLEFKLKKNNWDLEKLETIFGTIQIHILRMHNFGLFLNHPPTHYVSINTELNVSKTGHFLDPPTHPVLLDSNELPIMLRF